MSSFNDTFTPLFIIITLVVLICGLVLFQFVCKMFIGSKNLSAIKMFGITILINIIILIFLIMSFSKINLTQGPVGPAGNKGSKGVNGQNGALALCGTQTQTSEDKKYNLKRLGSYDLKLPLIKNDP